MPDAFSVLFVCTGNICRSPIAEQVFRKRFDSPWLTFASAGTAALVGAGMPPQAIAEARRLDAAPGDHRARQLTEQLITEADLVLGLSRRHRAEVVRLVPRASRYTFTLREFVRLAEDAAVIPELWRSAFDRQSVAERLGDAVSVVASRRGHGSGTSAPDDDDVPDPYRRNDAAFELAGGLIDDSATRIRSAVVRVVARQRRLP